MNILLVNFCLIQALEKSLSPIDSRASGRNGRWELRDRAGITENTQDIISRSRKLLFNVVTETAYRFLNHQEHTLRWSIVITILVITAS